MWTRCWLGNVVTLTMSLSLSLVTAQFSSFSSQNLGPAQPGFGNSFGFDVFSSQSPSSSFSSLNAAPPQRNFNNNPGQLEFSNFVDLPSQRLRQPASAPRPEQNLAPDCALALTSGGCITYQDVNLAFGQAADSLPYLRLKFPAFGNFSNAEIGALATVLHETTRILAKVFHESK